MRKRRQTQLGQGMVEYTVITSLGILVLLGPGTDVIQYALRSIQDNYTGYSYAMSLSQWPEFDIRNAETIATPIVDVQSTIGNVASVAAELPPRAVPPATALTDFDFNSYRNWLTSQGVSDERATELAGPSLDGIFDHITSYFTGSIPGLDGLPSDLPPSVSDIVENLLPTSFF